LLQTRLLGRRVELRLEEGNPRRGATGTVVTVFRASLRTGGMALTNKTGCTVLLPGGELCDCMATQLRVLPEGPML
jgi:hypothetical protein